MCLGPIENLHDFVPVGHLLVVEVLDRCSSDDHTVIPLLLDCLKVLVEGHHMLYGCVLGGMALDLQQIHFDLQGRVGEQTDEVGLRCDFKGH